MANGGIIGPVQTVTAASTVSAKITSFTSTGTLTAQATANVEVLEKIQLSPTKQS